MDACRNSPSSSVSHDGSFIELSAFDEDFRLMRLSSLKISSNSESRSSPLTTSGSSGASFCLKARHSSQSIESNFPGRDSISPSKNIDSPSLPDADTPPAPTHALRVPSWPPQARTVQADDPNEEDCVTPVHVKHGGAGNLGAINCNESSTASTWEPVVSSYFSWKRVGSRNATPTASPASCRVIKRRR